MKPFIAGESINIPHSIIGPFALKVLSQVDEAIGVGEVEDGLSIEVLLVQVRTYGACCLW